MTYNLLIELVKRCGSQGLKVKAHQRRGDAAAEVTPVRCKAKQKTLTRLAEFSGWLLLQGETFAITPSAMRAAEK